MVAVVHVECDVPARRQVPALSGHSLPTHVDRRVDVTVSEHHRWEGTAPVRHVEYSTDRVGLLASFRAAATAVCHVVRGVSGRAFPDGADLQPVTPMPLLGETENGFRAYGGRGLVSDLVGRRGLGTAGRCGCGRGGGRPGREGSGRGGGAVAGGEAGAEGGAVAVGEGCSPDVVSAFPPVQPLSKTAASADAVNSLHGARMLCLRVAVRIPASVAIVRVIACVGAAQGKASSMRTRTIGNDTIGRETVGAIGLGLMTFDQSGSQPREQPREGGRGPRD